MFILSDTTMQLHASLFLLLSLASNSAAQHAHNHAHRDNPSIASDFAHALANRQIGWPRQSQYPPGPSSTTTTSTSALGTAPTGTSGDSCNDIGGQKYTHHTVYTFESGALPQGLEASNNEAEQLPNGKYMRKMDSSQVSFSGGFLELKVPGGQTQSPILGGEVRTTDGSIMYGSVTTTAILDTVEGVCHGFFFYAPNADECDIEYLTSSTSSANHAVGGGSGSGAVQPMQFTNMPASDASHYAWSCASSDATSTPHRYRMDWLGDQVLYYVDDAYQKTITTNVPKTPGKWMWNNWSDGNPGWSVGPPSGLSTLKIQKIEMYYNSSATPANC